MPKKLKNGHFGTSTALFSKSVQTVLRFWFQNMLIMVVVADYMYVCSWIARKAQNVGPKWQNRPDLDFSAIFSEFYQTNFLELCKDMYNMATDLTYKYVWPWIIKPYFVGPKWQKAEKRTFWNFDGTFLKICSDSFEILIPKHANYGHCCWL